MKNQDIQEALTWRYATKKFSPDKKISDADWQTLASALIHAPSSYGLQPWKFLVIENAEVRAKLKTASFGQTQVTDASHLVVFLSKEKLSKHDVAKHITRTAEMRGLARETLSGYEAMMNGNLVDGPASATIGFWAQRQAYIALGFLLETAALLKVDACPMEGIDTAAYDSILGLGGSGFKSVAVVTLGYRAADDGLQHAKKVRFPKEDLIQYVR